MAKKSEAKIENLPIPFFIRIVGTHPQLMHSGRLKNPLDPWAKEIRKYSGKRKKTDKDHIAMMEAEYKGSLYLADDDLEAVCDGEYPYWPADNIHACIKTAAKMKKMGKDFDSSVVIVPPGGRLIFKGPKTRYGLWDAGVKFRLDKATRRGTMCCRPLFIDWAVEFSAQVLSEGKINPEDFKRLVYEAGKFIGLSEWPRRWGLFAVDEIKQEEVTVNVRQ